MKILRIILFKVFYIALIMQNFTPKTIFFETLIFNFISDLVVGRGGVHGFRDLHPRVDRREQTGPTRDSDEGLQLQRRRAIPGERLLGSSSI